MHPHQYVVYHIKKRAFSATHEAINKTKVDLSKPVTYFRLWEVEKPSD